MKLRCNIYIQHPSIPSYTVTSGSQISRNTKYERQSMKLNPAFEGSYSKIYYGSAPVNARLFEMVIHGCR